MENSKVEEQRNDNLFNQFHMLQEATRQHELLASSLDEEFRDSLVDPSSIDRISNSSTSEMTPDRCVYFSSAIEQRVGEFRRTGDDGESRVGHIGDFEFTILRLTISPSVESCSIDAERDVRGSRDR